MARVGKGRISRAVFWREKIAEQAGSGLSISAFCRREGISPNSFYSWRRVLFSAGDAGPGPGVVGKSWPRVAEGVFAPLVVSAPGVIGIGGLTEVGGECRLEVVLPCGLRLRVHPGFDAETLRRLVAALDGRC